jgi:hypothetical protein
LDYIGIEGPFSSWARYFLFGFCTAFKWRWGPPSPSTGGSDVPRLIIEANTDDIFNTLFVNPLSLKLIYIVFKN